MPDETLVLCLSEHGRTPKFYDTNLGPGRGHWSEVYSQLFAGAGIRPGSVIGASDETAAFPAQRPISPKDILATLYHLLGFNVETTRTHDNLGRPHFLLPHGSVVPEML